MKEIDLEVFKLFRGMEEFKKFPDTYVMDVVKTDEDGNKRHEHYRTNSNQALNYRFNTECPACGELLDMKNPYCEICKKLYSIKTKQVLMYEITEIPETKG